MVEDRAMCLRTHGSEWYLEYREHLSRLLEFAREILAVCDDLNIAPIVSGSLAVLAYTRNDVTRVQDIDLACSQREFPRLRSALEARGIRCEGKDWHVMQARRDDLKVEFDSVEHWMAGIPDERSVLEIDGLTLRLVSLNGLKELYRRGVEATRGATEDGQRRKHADLQWKYGLLCSLPDAKGGR